MEPLDGTTTLWVFISVVVLVMSLMLVLSGAFTVYFGSGKSRAIGAGLLVAGLLIGILYVVAGSERFMGDPALIPVQTMLIIKYTVVFLTATIIGALAGLGIFLGAIMKA
ncbi:MAG: hypothetical protein J7L61_02035 [Thermoplasmata archaeon]|nr:hypothetical protein [Thermoplasmata archaeon]